MTISLTYVSRNWERLLSFLNSSGGRVLFLFLEVLLNFYFIHHGPFHGEKCLVRMIFKVKSGVHYITVTTLMLNITITSTSAQVNLQK